MIINRAAVQHKTGCHILSYPRCLGWNGMSHGEQWPPSPIRSTSGDDHGLESRPARPIANFSHFKLENSRNNSQHFPIPSSRLSIISLQGLDKDTLSLIHLTLLHRTNLTCFLPLALYGSKYNRSLWVKQPKISFFKKIRFRWTLLARLQSSDVLEI